MPRGAWLPTHEKLAQADAAQRARATDAFIRPLQVDLDDIGQSLTAETVTRDNLPADLVRDWIAPDGRSADRSLAQGQRQRQRDHRPVCAGRAGGGADRDRRGHRQHRVGHNHRRRLLPRPGLALISIAILLWIVLRRLTDVLVTLIPLIVAGLVTLEICALTKFELNYANIIALPVLLGVGVAFKIYYVTAWRRGESNFLKSVLTRAVFYSTLLTATAFGSLWLSNQPGISSMGKLLALSLVCTLTSAALFQPALMGGLHRLGR